MVDRRFLLRLAALSLAVGTLTVPAMVGPALARGVGDPADRASYAAWRERFVGQGGRVIDDANGGVSHSEGQGYGMLLAVFHDDRAVFEELWQWTRKTLSIRSDSLLAWRYDPSARPAVADTNNATDGDLLVAWALAEAFGRWGEPAFEEDACRIGADILRHTVVEHQGRAILLPGAAGFSAADRTDGPVVNLSYWVFPAFAALNEVKPDSRWRALADSGYALIEASRFGPDDLPSDWISLAAETPRPADGFNPVFGWNALRIPFHLAFAPPEWRGNRGLLAPFVSLWPLGASPRPIAVGSPATPLPPAFGSSGYDAVPALTACSAHAQPYPDSLTRFAEEPYFPATLRLLSLCAAKRWYPECLV
ncbi:endoglucanase [Fulvimarina manganoxydans]|uniref:cellulase n=1 Tax=Fulvimarina manganoxydans TaxID=937218 RepID=A0A1W2ER99_9HYPH|nr:glycosyl hydrolase family 8 [Fulvimarina manganoxydans]SMD12211.1 endoglucanase [Fulvimarina manganoxydans]